MLNEGCAVRVILDDGSPLDSPTHDIVQDLGCIQARVQIHMCADQIVDAAEPQKPLPSPLVFDHMRCLPQPAGIDHPAFQVVRRPIDEGRTSFKPSGVYQDSKVGPPI